MKIQIMKTEELFKGTPTPFAAYVTAFINLEFDACEGDLHSSHYRVRVGTIIDELAHRKRLGKEHNVICSGRDFWEWFRLISNGFDYCDFPKDCCEVLP